MNGGEIVILHGLSQIKNDVNNCSSRSISKISVGC